MIDPLLEIPEVVRARGGRRSKLYADIANKRWTPPLKVGRRSFWPASEVSELINAQIAGATDEQLHRLVGALVAKRRDRLPVDCAAAS